MRSQPDPANQLLVLWRQLPQGDQYRLLSFARVLHQQRIVKRQEWTARHRLL